MRIVSFFCVFLSCAAVFGQHYPTGQQSPYAVPSSQTAPSQVAPSQMPTSQMAPRQTPPRQTPPKASSTGPNNTHLVTGMPAAPQTYPQQIAPNQQTPTQAQQQLSAVPQIPRLAMNNTVTLPPNAGKSDPSAAGSEAVPAMAQPQPLLPPAPQAPFELSAEQEAELDAFLDRWEQHSTKIKRLEMSFLKYYFHDISVEQKEATHITRGSFNYVAPDRVLYHVEGEYDPKTRKVVGPKHQEKWLFDGKSIFEYYFNVSEVVETPLPPEYQGKGLADGPLPMIFGAKKDEMKRRYWLRIVTDPNYAKEQVWIEIRPRWRDDALEFSSLEMRVNAKTLEPFGLRKYDSGIGRNDYAFFDVKINSGIEKLLDVIAKLFKPDIPRGWKHVVRDLTESSESLMATPNGRPNTTPGTVPAQANPQIAQPYQPPQGQPQPPATRQFELYSAPEAQNRQPIYR